MQSAQSRQTRGRPKAEWVLGTSLAGLVKINKLHGADDPVYRY